MFWTFFTLLVLMLAYLGDKKCIKDQTINSIARGLLVFVLSYAIALCSNGTDRHEYLYFYDNTISNWNIFDIMQASMQSDEMEVGFMLMAEVCMLLGLSGVGFLFVTSIITNSLFVSVFYRYKYPVIIIFLYILSRGYYQEANLFRQMLAVAIGMYATRYIPEKKIKKYVLLVLLAFLIHRSALILLIFIPFIYFQEEHYKTVKLVLLALWVISFGFYFNIFPQFTYLEAFFIDTKYEHYAALETGLGGANEITLNFMYILFVVFFFVFSNKPQYQITAVFFVMGNVLENASFGAQYFSRMSLYFSSMFCIYLPTLLTDNRITKNKKGNRYTSTFLVLLVLYYLRRLFIDRVLSSDNLIGGNIGNILDIFM